MPLSALLGKKLGMSQLFNEDGAVTPVTAVQLGPCTIVRHKTKNRDGYTAVVVGYDEKKPKRTNNPEMGLFKKINTTPKKWLKEIPVSDPTLDELTPGSIVTITDVFKVGDTIDATGTSKGRGFSGVVKRHGFHGPASLTHGTHEAKRHGGSIGQCATPSRTFKNVRMAGQYGNKTKTVQNLKIVQVLEDDGIALIKGAIPGASNGYILIKRSVKSSS